MVVGERRRAPGRVGACARRRPWPWPCPRRGTARPWRSAVGRPRFASVGSQRARGRSGLSFPASLHLSPGRGAREIRRGPGPCKAARPAESEPEAGEKGEPAPRPGNVPAGSRLSRRRQEGRLLGARGSQRLPPPHPQGPRLLRQRCWCRPQKKPGTPQKDNMPGNSDAFRRWMNPCVYWLFSRSGLSVGPQPRCLRSPWSR